MSIDSRSRMVTFRLTEQEYERFRELCYMRGIRSVSEMARMAINMLFQQAAGLSHETLEMRVSEMEGRLHLLALEVKKLTSGRRRSDFAPAGLKLAATQASD